MIMHKRRLVAMTVDDDIDDAYYDDGVRGFSNNEDGYIDGDCGGGGCDSGNENENDE